MLNVRKLLDTWEMLGRRPLRAEFRPAVAHAAQGRIAGGLVSWRCRTGGRPGAAGQLVERLRGASRRNVIDDARTSRHRPARLRSAAKGAENFARFAHLRPHGAAVVRDGLLENDRRAGHRALCEQGQRRLRPRSAHAIAAAAITTAIWRPWAIICWSYYRRAIDAAGMTGRALVGELPFRWQTDFHFAWWGGWLKNRQDETFERDLVVVIPGRDRRRAVIMADHYDTAYMEDLFGYPRRRTGRGWPPPAPTTTTRPPPRLMLAAPIFLDLAAARQAGLRHLAGPPHRRRVSRRLHGRPAPLPMPGRGTLRMRAGRWALAGSLAKPRPGRLRLGHGGP